MRTMSEAMEKMPGTTTVEDERDSRWCERIRCDSSWARRMASSVVCSGVGCGLATGVDDDGRRFPSRSDHHDVFFFTEDASD